MDLLPHTFVASCGRKNTKVSSDGTYYQESSKLAILTTVPPPPAPLYDGPNTIISTTYGANFHYIIIDQPTTINVWENVDDPNTFVDVIAIDSGNITESSSLANVVLPAASYNLTRKIKIGLS